MRLVHLVPAALLLALAEATVTSFAPVVAEREGGMGLGSALVAGHMAHLGALAPGALGAAWSVDRGWPRAALVVGAILFAIGSVGVATQPMHALDWVIVASALAGAGVGAVVVAAFSAAARLEGRTRALGVALLLVATLVGRSLIGVVVVGGSIGLATAAAAAIALAAAGAATWGASFAGEARADGRTSAAAPRAMPMVRVVPAAMLLAIGIVALTAGADPSGVSAIMLAGPLGFADLEQLDRVRTVLIGVGAVALIAGALVVLVGARSSRRIAFPAVALALATAAVAGTVAALGRLGGRPDATLIAASAAVGGAAAIAGIVVGAWLASRRGDRGVVAVVGCVVVAGGAAVAIAVVDVVPLAGAPLIATPVVAASAFGGGLATVALRTVLADVRVGVLGLAASAGALATIWGGSVGSLVGVGEAFGSELGDGAVPVGGLVLVAAAVAAIVVTARLPSDAAAVG